MFKRIKEDIITIFQRDPAARSLLEVIICYPGLHAILFHRVAHRLYRHGWYFVARVISHTARFLTGIEIHPGAEIGRRFFIDHGMGVVIGETTEIGDDVTLYKGVLLGGTSLEKKKRHPTILDGVVVGSDAIILGAIVLGENSRIGAGSVVVHDVPAGATAIGVPARIGLGFTSTDIEKLEHGKLPDPIAEAIKFVLKEQEKLEQRIAKLESKEGIATEIDDSDSHMKKVINEEFEDSSPNIEYYL
ncbi:MAG: serine O-acetyltransferase [Endomicrobiales bacterium]|jgi:serine O-acetyltransferase